MTGRMFDDGICSMYEVFNAMSRPGKKFEK